MSMKIAVDIEVVEIDYIMIAICVDITPNQRWMWQLTL